MRKDAIAMVDDEADLIETYSELLSEKYDVMTFNSPEEYYQYLDKFQETPFKVLISDYRLGPKTGIDMIKELKLAKRDSPFILMSGYLDKATVMAAHDLGAHRILEKPVPIESLEFAVQELLIEGKIDKVRKEMRQITLQLKEVSSYFDLIITQYAPAEEVNKFFMSMADGNPHFKFSSFKDFVDGIEQKLYVLMKSEDILQKQLLQVQKAQNSVPKAA